MEKRKQQGNINIPSSGEGGGKHSTDSRSGLSFFQFCPHCGGSNFVDNDFKSKRCLDCGFVFYINASAAVAAFVLDGKGRLLAEHRRLEPSKGMLALPGGSSTRERLLRKAWQGKSGRRPDSLPPRRNICSASLTSICIQDLPCRLLTCSSFAASTGNGRSCMPPMMPLMLYGSILRI